MNSKYISALIILVVLVSGLQARKFSFKRQILEKIYIENNNAFTDSRLKSFLLSKEDKFYHIFNHKKLSRANARFDEKQLARFYGQKGYHFAQVTSEAGYYPEDSTKAVLAFYINEGPQSFVDTVYNSGGIEELSPEIRKLVGKIKIKTSANKDLIYGTAQKMRDLYADNGYPLATIEPQLIYNEDTTSVQIIYNIAEGDFVHIGKIKIVKEDSVGTKNFVFRRELLTEPGALYSRKDIMESQHRLYSTGLIKFVSIKRSGDIYFKEPDSAFADLRVILNSRKPFFVNIRFGIGQDEDFESVLQPSISFGNRDLWGTGRRVVFSAKSTIQLQKVGTGDNQDTTVTSIGDLFSNLKIQPVKQAFEVSYVEPWFLGHRIPLSLSYLAEPHNKNPILQKFYNRHSVNLSLFKEVDRFTFFRFSSSVEFVDILDVAEEDEAKFRLEGDNTIRRRLSIYGQRDTRDNFFIPQRGSYSFVSVDYVGHYLGGDFSFLKGEASWRRYKQILGNNILATRLNLGILKELGKNGNSASDDRFMLGGAKTVRGYSEDNLGPKWDADEAPTEDLIGQPKGGKLKVLANVEIRRSLFWRIGGTAFVDIGNVFFDVKDFKLSKIEASSGLGLQFFTPVGPIRFDYAFKVKDELDLADYAYHLTLLYAF